MTAPTAHPAKWRPNHRQPAVLTGQRTPSSSGELHSPADFSIESPTSLVVGHRRSRRTKMNLTIVLFREPSAGYDSKRAFLRRRNFKVVEILGGHFLAQTEVISVRRLSFTKTGADVYRIDKGHSPTGPVGTANGLDRCEALRRLALRPHRQVDRDCGCEVPSTGHCAGRVGPDMQTSCREVAWTRT